MIAQQTDTVKTDAKLETLRDIRTIVCADWRRAEGWGDLAEVAACRAEYKLIQAEIHLLTDGRGW